MEGFLTISYCFPYCFLIFVGGQGFDEGGQSHDGGILPVPPPGKTLERVGVPLATHL